MDEYEFKRKPDNYQDREIGITPILLTSPEDHEATADDSPNSTPIDDRENEVDQCR